MAEPTKELITSMADRWAAGERLPALARDASAAVGRELACATVRNWIVKHLGGPEKFKAASTKRDEEHPRAVNFGGGRVAVTIDDSAVDMVVHGKGWKVDQFIVRGRPEDVFTAPDGKRYVVALGNEKADLLFKSKTKGLPVMRLRLESTSHTARRAKKEAAVVAHGEVQRARRTVRRKGTK